MTEQIIGRTGRIIAGKELGWFVKIEDDSENTGGFLILTSNDREFRGGVGYDNWVLDQQSLEQYMKEAGWLIEWLD